MKNKGRSTAKSISLFGWIPSDWNIELTENGDLKGKIYSETKISHGDRPQIGLW